MLFGRQPRTILLGIPDGAAGTLETLNIMKRIIKQSRSNPVVYTAARDLTRDLRPKDRIAELRAVHEFVRDGIRYVRDPVGLESVQTPENTLEIGQGDCDDKVVLAGSLLTSLGFPTRSVAIGFLPGQFSHVYIQARLGRGWISMETTEPYPLGKEPRSDAIVERMVVYNK